MLDVICWKWNTPGYRSQFGPSTVNILRNMVKRNLKLPHRFTCLTDDARGIDTDIRVIPLGDLFASIPNPSNARNPSCYRRLQMFSAEAAALIGENIVSMDLDMVVTGDLTPLFDHQEEFKIWGGQSVVPRGGRAYNWYNGSLMQLRAGARTQVWERFDPATSPKLANAAGCRGSDQGWISFVLGKGEKTWGIKDGVYSFRVDLAQHRRRPLPDGVRIVAFHGAHDPWMQQVQSEYPWVKEHYQ